MTDTLKAQLTQVLQEFCRDGMFADEAAEAALSTVSRWFADDGLVLTRSDPSEYHSDDVAIDSFAVALKAKLAKKRKDGRGGWHDPEQCSAAFLSKLMREHMEKGDPLDVGAFAMMLQQRGEPIQSIQNEPAAVEDGELAAVKAERNRAHRDCELLAKQITILVAERDDIRNFKNAVMGWRERDWPSWFCRKTADRIVAIAIARSAHD